MTKLTIIKPPPSISGDKIKASPRATRAAERVLGVSLVVKIKERRRAARG